jgi:hypothetical protein
MNKPMTARVARQKARDLRELALRQTNPAARAELKSVADEYGLLAVELERVEARARGESGE